MDPFATLNAVANIIQFVGYTRDVYAQLREIEASVAGITKRDQELISSASELSEMVDVLLASTNATSGPTSAALLERIRDLGQQCQALVDELKNHIASKGVKNRSNILSAAKSVVFNTPRKPLVQTFAYSHQVFNQQRDVQSTLVSLRDQNRRLEMKRSEEIRQLNDNVLAVIPSIEELLKGNRNVQMKDEIDRVCLEVGHWARQGKGLSREQSIIASLRYDDMSKRRDSIPAAHRRTFQWIHDQGIHFQRWLQEDAGVFWISGEAGSGKSTLIKYLCQDDATDDALRRWAGEKNLVKVSFYFWFNGTALEKSQEGLLRSLLFEIFRKCPSAIKEACPGRWKEDPGQPWSLSELMDTMASLQLELAKTRFCFFIDGLDEYCADEELSTGDPEHVKQIIRVMHRLSNMPNVKLCISSRPWHLFDREYDLSGQFTVLVNEKNRGDIRLYVQDRFDEAKVFADSWNRPEDLQNLIDEIVEESRGVFLWVALVIESLLDGLSNRDRVSELRKRLVETPKTLPAVFERMLASVEPTYHEHAAKILMVALHAVEPMPTVVYSYIGEDDYNALTEAIEPWSAEKCAGVADEARVRIKVRCPDLIKVTSPAKEFQDARDLGRHKVDFLHRTVKDYLTLKQTHDQLTARFCKPFSWDQFLCESLLIRLKKYRISDDYKRLREDPLGVWNVVHCILHHAKRLERDGKNTHFTLLDELNRVMSTQMERNDFVVRGSSFMNIMVQYDLQLYIDHKMSKGLAHSRVPLLKSALMLFSNDDLPLKRGTPSPKMVSLILSHGANPNDIVTGTTTIWHLFMRDLYAQVGRQSLSDTSFDIIVEMLKHSADPKLQCVVGMTEPKATVGRAKGIKYPQTKGLLEMLRRMSSAEQLLALDSLIQEKQASPWTSLLKILWLR